MRVQRWWEAWIALGLLLTVNASGAAAASGAAVSEPATDYTPGEGFDVVKGRYGSLNISAYVLFRYLNQLPAEQTFVDHLGNTRVIDTRNDFQLHRVLLHFKGFLFTEKLKQDTTVWAVNSTNSITIISSLN